MRLTAAYRGDHQAHQDGSETSVYRRHGDIFATLITYRNWGDGI